MEQEQDNKQRVRNVIAEIVSIVNDSNDRDSSQNLWWILTALRGPDSENLFVKDETTARLRGALGLFECNPAGCDVSKETPIKLDRKDQTLFEFDLSNFSLRFQQSIQSQAESHHFLNHYRLGYRALEWLKKS